MHSDHEVARRSAPCARSPRSIIAIIWIFSARARAFVLLRRASHFLLRGQEKVTKEKATPLGACRPTMGGKSVSRGRAFRPDSCPGEKESTSVSTPLRACRPRLTAAQGPRAEQRAIGQLLLRCVNSGIHALAMARTRYATAARWRKPRSQEQEGPAASGTFNTANVAVRLGGDGRLQHIDAAELSFKTCRARAAYQVHCPACRLR